MADQPGASGSGPNPILPDLTVGGRGGGGGGTSGPSPAPIFPELECGGPERADGHVLYSDLTQIVGHICFGACFLTIIMRKISEEHHDILGDVEDLSTRIVNNIVGGLASQVSPIASWVESFISDLVDTSAAFWDKFQVIFTGDYWKDIGLTMVTTLITRSLGLILAAVIQNIINFMDEDLDNRKNLLQGVSDELNTIKQSIQEIIGLGYWEDLKKAIDASSKSVKSAKGQVARAQGDIQIDEWNADGIENASTELWNAEWHISSEERRREMESEGGEYSSWGEWNPSRYYKAKGFKAGDHWKEIYESLIKLKEYYDCLLNTTARLKLYYEILLGLQYLIERLKGLGAFSNPAAFIGIKIPGLQELFSGIYQQLQNVQNQMEDVVDNNKQFVAPMLVSPWQTQLQSLRFALLAFTGTDINPDKMSGIDLEIISEWGREPSWTPFLSQPAGEFSADALNDLSSVMSGLEGKSFAIDNIQQLLSMFINRATNLGNIIFFYDNWETEFENIEKEVRLLRRDDSSTKEILSRYQGYESGEFDLLVKILEENGKTDAVRKLMVGDFSFLHDTINTIGGVMSGLECIINTINISDKIDIPTSLEGFVNNEMADLWAAEEVSARSAMTLPSVMWKYQNVLTEYLSTLQAKISELDEYWSFCETEEA